MKKEVSYTKFTKSKRLKLEALYNAKVPVKKIAEELGFTVQSIYREIKRGLYSHMNTDWTFTERYSADKAQEIADYANTSKGAPLKIGNDKDFADFVETMIVEHKYSPAAVLGYIKEHNLKFKTKVCRVTLYNYIEQGVFLNLSVKNLLRKGKMKRKYGSKRKTAKKLPKNRSIEERSPEVLTRNTFGHWELDSIIGTREKGVTLLSFVERKTRMLLIFKSKDKTAASTVALLNRLERKLGSNFSKIFKTITCDNGVEFSNCKGMETSNNGKRRTTIYYCHPYCSSERGSNENQNGFVRRFIPKGKSLKNYSAAQIKDIQDFINTYPRAIFDYKNSSDLFNTEISRLGIKNFNFFNFTT